MVREFIWFSRLDLSFADKTYIRFAIAFSPVASVLLVPGINDIIGAGARPKTAAALPPPKPKLFTLFYVVVSKNTLISTKEVFYPACNFPLGQGLCVAKTFIPHSSNGISGFDFLKSAFGSTNPFCSIMAVLIMETMPEAPSRCLTLLVCALSLLYTFLDIPDTDFFLVYIVFEGIVYVQTYFDFTEPINKGSLLLRPAPKTL